jgi:alkanesulfonate monooxygenase SsuD/methylene tetrahydromethanopterin reductase-like flavin-dependent oxidoreductase (luciferase family)
MALRLGVWAPVWGTFLVQQEPPGDVREATFEHNLRYIRRAEELGFESTLLLDRSLNSIKGPGAPILEAWITAAALAPLTRRIELIVASRSAYRHPALAAQMGANIDRISGGRFAINIVSGWWQHEHDMAGIPFPPHDRRYDLSAEAMEVLRKFWTEDHFAFEGEFFRIRDGVCAPKPIRKPWPTFYFGGESEAAVRLAARAADVFLFNGRPFEDARALMDAVRVEAEACKRSVGFGMSTFAICRETEAAARQEHERLRSLLGPAAVITGVDREARHRRTSVQADRVGTNGGTAAGLVGSPATLASRILEFHRAGVDLFLFQFHPMLEEMERFAREVMPLLPLGERAGAWAG